MANSSQRVGQACVGRIERFRSGVERGLGSSDVTVAERRQAGSGLSVAGSQVVGGEVAEDAQSHGGDEGDHGDCNTGDRDGPPTLGRAAPKCDQAQVRSERERNEGGCTQEPAELAAGGDVHCDGDQNSVHDAASSGDDGQHVSEHGGEGADRLADDPARLRAPRARREQDGIGLEGHRLVDAELVVAHHHRVGPELAQVLHEVVDEAVVAVDHQHTRGRPGRSSGVVAHRPSMERSGPMHAP